MFLDLWLIKVYSPSGFTVPCKFPHLPSSLQAEDDETRKKGDLKSERELRPVFFSTPRENVNETNEGLGRDVKATLFARREKN